MFSQPILAGEEAYYDDPSPWKNSNAIQRRSIQRPSQMTHGFNHSSNSHTTSSHNTLDQRMPSQTQSQKPLPDKTSLQLLQVKEEKKQAKKLLKNALAQLAMEVERATLLEGRVKELETRVEQDRIERAERENGMGKALKGVLDEQRGRAGGGKEVEVLKLKLSNTEKELQRVKEDYRALQIERDDSDRALVRARTLAREMKEKAILIQAREKGRQEGFEEGLKHGRLMAPSIEEDSSDDEASGSGNGGRRTRKRGTNRKTSAQRHGRHRSNTNPDAVSAMEAEASRAIAERENLRVQLQLKEVEKELDMERSKMKDMAREKAHLEKSVREEREREMEREKEKFKEIEAKQREKEREMREILKKEAEKQRWEREREKERLEKEKEQIEKDKRDVEKKLAEAEQRRIKDKEKFEKQLKKEKEKAPLPYLAMAPPPARGPSASSTTTTSDPKTRVPAFSRPSSSASHRNQQGRRFSTDSYTSQASTIPFEMLQLPGDRERERGGGRDLSVIPEDASVRGASTSPSVTNSVPASAAPVPSWVTNPPVDYGKPDLHWPQEPTNGHGGPYPPYNQQHNQDDRPDYLTAPYNNGSSRRSSTGSYEITIVPPSRPESVLGGADPDPYNTHSSHNNTHNHNNDRHLLSPNLQPAPLPQTQTHHNRSESPAVKPIPPQRFQYNVPTQPNSPITGTIDLKGGFPPGFIPQSITDARGRSTPIGGPSGFIPPSRSATPSTQWNNPVIPPVPPAPTGPAAIPIYGNPVMLERDKRRDDEDDTKVGVFATPMTTAPPPQSPGAAWSAPLHPPIFPASGNQQPFQQPPPGGTWGGRPTSPMSMNNHQLKPSFEYSSSPSNTRPVIPGQTSTLGGVGGTPILRPTSGFGNAGAGMTPGHRNYELPPVIPGQTGSGGSAWGTPHHRPASGFGGGGMTPGSRNYDLPPVIPGQTSSAWTPGHRAGGLGAGMTPGPMNQDLPPVIPSQTGGGSAWNTPRIPPGSFGSAGRTPGPRNQDLPPAGGSSIPIYGRPASPYPDHPYLNEEDGGEEDPVKAAMGQNGLNTAGGGKGGKKAGKKGKKR